MKPKFRFERRPTLAPAPQKRKRKLRPMNKNTITEEKQETPLSVKATADGGEAVRNNSYEVTPEQSANLTVDVTVTGGAGYDRPAPELTERRPSLKLRQDKAQPRPSDRLRRDGETTAATSGQLVPKLDKDEKRLKKSKFRMEKTEVKLDKAKNKLATQKPYKPPGLVKTLTRALGNEAWGQLHGEVSKYERDNVGLEAAHSLEKGAESTTRTTTRLAKRRIRTRPRRQATKWERKNINAKVDYSFRQMAQEHPELKKNVFKKHLQKRRLKQDFQKQAKQAAAKGAVNTVKKTAQAVEKATRAIVGFIARHPAAALTIIIVFLLVSSLQSCMNSAFTIGSGLGGGIGGTSYLAEDADITEAELRYTEWETELLLSARNAATTYVGYDEYRYNIGNIGHNPFELIAFLTVKYNDFTYSGVESVLREIFNQQYTLTYTATTETRGEGEDIYEVRVLTATLTARSFSEVIAPRITTQEQRERLTVLMLTKGNRPYLFPNGDIGLPVYGDPGAPMGDGSYAALIAEAERYIGYPYVFGGSTPSTSFDCSGYICYIFTHSGVRNLPRTTAQGIYNQCTPISASAAQPGDLVFFHSTYSCPDTITHIGLYVGGGMMIHCGNPIGYTSINTTYWQQHFYAFGRFN